MGITTNKMAQLKNRIANLEAQLEKKEKEIKRLHEVFASFQDEMKRRGYLIKSFERTKSLMKKHLREMSELLEILER